MRTEKQFLVEEVAGQLAKSDYLLLVDFARVTVQDVATIRNQLQPLGAEYHVVKNSIFNIAAKQANLPDLAEHLAGHTALITGGKDPSGVAKVVVKFFEGNSKLEAKVGVMDEKLLSKSDIEALSKLPSLDGVRAQILSLLSTPASQIVRLLVAKNEKEEGQEAA